MERTLSLARDFSKFPAGRYRSDGPFPGEAFRDDILVPALAKPGVVIVIELDGTLGYGSSFLEEAFGGLVRSRGFELPDLKARLRLVSEDSSLTREIWQYIDHAAEVRSRK